MSPIPGNYFFAVIVEIIVATCNYVHAVIYSSKVHILARNDFTDPNTSVLNKMAPLTSVQKNPSILVLFREHSSA